MVERQKGDAVAQYKWQVGLFACPPPQYVMKCFCDSNKDTAKDGQCSGWCVAHSSSGTRRNMDCKVSV